MNFTFSQILGTQFLLHYLLCDTQNFGLHNWT